MNNCILWTKGKSNHSGYGGKSYKGKTIGAHRWSYIVNKGDIPKGKHVLHKCDVKLCINPDHLYLGTPKDNARDMVKRGQIATGKRHGRYTHPETIKYGQDHQNSVLNHLQVTASKDLHSYGWSAIRIADLFNVHQTTILRAINGVTYKTAMLKAEKEAQCDT